MADIRHVDQLLELDDTEFIEAAYRTLLDREPDAEGLRHHASRLRAGCGKMSVLREVCASSEAKAIGRHLPGLKETLEERGWFSRLVGGRRQTERRVSRQLNRVENELGRARRELRDFKAQTAEQLKGLEEAVRTLTETLRSANGPEEGTAHRRQPAPGASAEGTPAAGSDAPDPSTLSPLARQIFRDISAAIAEADESDNAP